MAIAPTGAIYKALSFDNVSSRNYGVYITGQAVYNAPTRDVEMISIPGRNGAFALDKGRFENIEVSYPAGIFADNETDFAAAISNFRNFLCSRNGYVRLSDEYNPNEYRMAIYKSGLEVTPAQLKAGEFEIVFDCKPQRWLTSGETAITVSSGDTVTNPTLFESSPFLEFDGYGKINFNGYEVELYHEALGYVTLWEITGGFSTRSSSFPYQKTKSFNTEKILLGDPLSLGTGNPASNASLSSTFPVNQGYECTSATIDSSTGDMPTYSTSVSISSSRHINVYLNTDTLAFIYGTPKSYTRQLTVSGNIKNTSTQVTTAYQVMASFTIAYDGNDTITYTWTPNIVSDPSGAILYNDGLLLNVSYRWSTLSADSSLSTIGNPTYIDCEIGEAYMIDNGTYISLNNNVELGAELPKLSLGANQFSFDNTVTNLKIVPRWWKV